MIRLNQATHPELASLKPGRLELNWSRHATLQAASKQVTQLWTCTIQAGQVVEVERWSATSPASKLVVRYPSIRTGWDDVLVLVRSNGGWLVVTCWRNASSDKHATLRHDRLSA